MSSVSFAVAQEADREADKDAKKFDEFGSIGYCDYSARMDNFAITLQSDPNVVGYVVYYGPELYIAGDVNYMLLRAKYYLTNTRGIDEERVKYIYGGRYKKLDEALTQLWIAPQGSIPPALEGFADTANAVATFSGKYAEYDASDTNGEEEAIGPSSGEVLLAGFADILRQQPETRAYIVSYNTQNSATGAWRRVARRIADNLQNIYKVQADRLEIIRGSDVTTSKDEWGQAKIQLWVLPKGAPPPVAAATEPEPRPTESVRIGSFSSYSLQTADEVRTAFEGFADVLRNDEQLSVCIIVSPSQAAQENPADDEPPKVDLLALVDKWKSDLKQKYGIDEHRLNVIVTPEDEFSPGTLETWLVPSGAAMPDPYASTDEEMAGEEATAEETAAETP